MDERLNHQLDFALEIDKEKNIFRQTHLSGHGRRENDSEHSWHMAIMAYVLREYSEEPVDIARVMLLCLIHDIVEIDAGDTYAYDTEGLKTQKAREDAAKERIFSFRSAQHRWDPKTQRPELYLLNAGFYLSFATMCYFPTLLLAVWGIIALGIVRRGSFRLHLIPFIGLLLPYFFYFAAHYLMGDWLEVLGRYGAFFQGIHFTLQGFRRNPPLFSFWIQ